MTTDVRDARGLPEEGFHEIQLSGKQLVFLFMATTVVSVVIFLCGVLVGSRCRGPTRRSESTPVAAGPHGRDAAASAGADAPRADANARDRAQAGRAELPEALSAVDQQKPNAASRRRSCETADAEPPAPVAETTPSHAATAPAPRSRPPPLRRRLPRAAAAARPAPPAARPPARPAGAFTVQVAALGNRRGRRHRDAPRRVAATTPTCSIPRPGAPPLYRVRVGPSRTGREAEKVDEAPRARRAVQALDYALAAPVGRRCSRSAFPSSATPPSPGWRSSRCCVALARSSGVARHPAVAPGRSCSALITGIVDFAGTLYWIADVMVDVRRAAAAWSRFRLPACSSPSGGVSRAVRVLGHRRRAVARWADMQALCDRAVRLGRAPSGCAATLFSGIPVGAARIQPGRPCCPIAQSAEPGRDLRAVGARRRRSAPRIAALISARPVRAGAALAGGRRAACAC